MGMDPLTLGAISMGAGSLLNLGSSVLSNRSANKTAKKRESAAGAMIEREPSPYEQMLSQFLGGSSIPSAESLTSGQGFNTGQDALMQLLRANPHTQVDANLDALARTGLPYNMSPAFDAFKATDQQALAQQVAGLHAGASGLGQRFGSSMMNAEAALRATLTGQTQARNAQMGAQAYESAMQRMLGGNELLSGREQAGQQMQSSVAQALLQSALGAGNFGLQSVQTRMSGLGQLLSAGQNRQAQNTQLLSLMFGLPPAQAPNLGGGFSDMGQLLMLLPLLRQMGTTGGK